MKGKIFPETTFQDNSDYFSKNLGGSFNPDQFVIIKKEIGEIVLYRNSIPVIFHGRRSNYGDPHRCHNARISRKQEVRQMWLNQSFLQE